jgi:uncharacterized protein (TIGR02145 family)
VAGADGYRIYRGTSLAGSYERVGTSTTASYTNSSLTAGPAYYYRISGYNSGGEGSQSDAVSATTLPVAPTGVTATANSATSITIGWSSVTGATGYRVYRSSTTSGTYEEVGTSATTSYENTGLTASTAYYYKVAAYSNGGEGSQSSYATATTREVGTPTGVTAAANSTSSITVSWSSVAGADGYRIYRSTASSGTYIQVGTSETALYTDNDLSDGTAYYYKVTAYNSGGEGSQSNVASGTTQPVAPTGVKVEISGTRSITIGWSSVTGATGYRVYRSSASSGTYIQVGTSATTTYTNAGLTESTTYYYKVAAYNNGGQGSQSDTVSATTKLYGTVSDGQRSYRTVVIGTQTWMAENLNYAVDGSVCYGNNTANCDTYGRLYDWATTMALPSNCNSTICVSQISVKHRGICPTGWHLPSDAEWTALTDYVGGLSTAGTKLKAISGWNGNGNGTDDYGFTALPGGLSYGFSIGDFNSVGGDGRWWSSTERNASIVYYRNMNYGNANVRRLDDDKTRLLSVRCVQD